MVSVVEGSAHSHIHLEGILRIAQIRIYYIIAVVHRLESDEISFLIAHSVYFHRRRKTVFGKFLSCLILVVEPVALSVIEGSRPRPSLIELMGIVQLKVVLGVVVGLIVVVMDITEAVVVLTCRIISSILFELRFGDAAPSDAGVLITHNVCKSQRILLTHPA